MDKMSMTDGRVAPPPGPEELLVVRVILAGLVVSSVFFTVLHHGFPRVLDVPSREGIPLSDFPTMFILDLGVMGMAWMCFRHAWRRLGLFAATVFLGGSFVFTGVEESMWILIGRYAVGFGPPGVDGVMGGMPTYYFTRGFFWFLETPVTACLGWFFIAYACVYMAELLIPRAPLTLRAALGGFLAMDVDLWTDPVQTHPIYRAWVWADQPGGIWIFGIPITNFIGWFLLIFIFAIVFDKLPAMVNRWGLKKGVALFYGILMVIEIGILVFFIVYGSIEQSLISPKLNLTLWGVGS